MFTSTKTNLKLRNKGCITIRKDAKRSLERYKQYNKKEGLSLDGDIVHSFRNFGREEARYFHVAYSLARGRKYSEIERSCNKKLDPKKLTDVFRSNASFGDRRKYNLEAVKKMLSS